ncbi:MAG TPA: vitamin K epoxide reductase family protein [Streptosporangiaceae bacterium]|nr:vitamin K epoxide reductase family protein [Streptosporangiaceae bacterium]
MTASKSSRARNARAAAQAGAQAGAARNGARGGTAVKNASAARNGAAARGPRTIEVRDEPAERGPAPWLQIATFVLALAGLGVSIYLTIAHFTESALAGCSESGLVNCTKVTTSPQSYVFGIPVAVLGLAFFVFCVAIMSPWAWRASRREIHLVRIASLVVGIGFVLYLVYAELFTIGSICLYCTSVHVITFLLFVLTAFAAAAWGLKPGAPGSSSPTASRSNPVSNTSHISTASTAFPVS